MRLQLILLLLFSAFASAQVPTLMLPIGHTAHINSAVFISDGKKIVTSSNDGTAKIWDAASGKLLATLKGHTSEVNSAQFSPACLNDPIGGKIVITTSKDATAKIWDASSGMLLANLTGH